jgi:ABC-type multidrug transport system fused ATPase/permease subunit
VKLTEFVIDSFEFCNNNFAKLRDTWAVFTCYVQNYSKYFSDFVGANVGLAITQAINLIGMCNWGLRQTAELENQMTSVERVIEYANLTSERSLETDERRLNKMPMHWPQRGLIKFNNVSLKYSDTSDYVLHNLSFILSERVTFR